MSRSITGSIALDGAEDSPSISRLARLKRDSLLSARRSMSGSERQDDSEFLAQQNVIIDRFNKYDVCFERSKIQTEEVQTQLAEQQDQLIDIQSQLGVLQEQYEAMQRQQDRIIDLLERLSSERMNASVSPGITEQLTAAVNGAPDVPSPDAPKVTVTRVDAPAQTTIQVSNAAEPVSLKVPVPQAVASVQTAIQLPNAGSPLYLMSASPKKTSRPVGRPRKLCKKCKQEKPLQPDNPYCQDCIKPLQHALEPKKRPLTAKDRTENANAKESKKPRVAYAQDARIRISKSPAQDLIKHPQLPATQIASQYMPTSPTAEVAIRVSRPESATKPAEPRSTTATTTKTPSSSINSRNRHNPAIEKLNTNVPSATAREASITLAPPPQDLPFVEDSAELTPHYADIVDPDSESMDTASTHSFKSTTSIAESLSIDDTLTSYRRRRANPRRNSTEERVSASQLRRERLLRLARGSLGETRDERNANSVVPLGQAPKANMIVKPRRPVPSSPPEGKTGASHEILVEKIMGTSWQAVNRRF